ncbi:MAG: hypothetical protein V1849_01885 [Chloroflexota bacterium]
MRTLICPQYCSVPFCEASCPFGAITTVAKEKNVYCETDKCNRCGICRLMCVTYSGDGVLAKKRPWVSSDWITLRR